MSMLGHAIAVMIVKKEGEPLILDFWLDNEEYLELRKKTDMSPPAPELVKALTM